MGKGIKKKKVGICDVKHRCRVQMATINAPEEFLSNEGDILLTSLGHFDKSVTWLTQRFTFHTLARLSLTLIAAGRQFGSFPRTAGGQPFWRGAQGESVGPEDKLFVGARQIHSGEAPAISQLTIQAPANAAIFKRLWVSTVYRQIQRAFTVAHLPRLNVSIAI